MCHYVLRLYLILLLTTIGLTHEVCAERYTFYERISEPLGLDTVTDVVFAHPYYYLLGSHGATYDVYLLEDGRPRALNIDVGIDLSEAQLSARGGHLILSDDRGLAFQWEGDKMVNVEYSDECSGAIYRVEQNIITSLGPIDQVQLICHEDLAQRYLIHQGYLFKYSPVINDHIEYHIFPGLEEHSSLVALPISDDRMVLSYYHPNTLYILDDGEMIDVLDRAINQEIATKERLYYHAVSKGHFVYFNTDDFLLIRLDLRDYSMAIVQEHEAKLKNIFIDQDDQIWLGSKFGEIFSYDPDQNRLTSRFNRSRRKIDTFRAYQDSNGWIWWGFHNGLAVAIPDRDKWYYYENLSDLTLRNDISISAIEQIEDKLYLGTYSEGAFVLDYGQVATEISAALTEDREVYWDRVSVDKLWFFHNKNINEIEYFNSTHGVLGVRTKGAYYTIFDDVITKDKESGYLASIQNFFSRYDDEGRVILSIPGGYCTIDLQATQEHLFDPSFYISSLTLGDEVLDFDLLHEGSVRIDDRSSYLRIGLSSVNTTSLPAEYTYRINKGNWKTSSIPEIIFASKDLGTHHIEINRLNDDHIADPLNMTVVIYRKWQDSYWLKGVLGLIVIALMAKVWSQYDREKKLQQNIKSLETASLRSYMNPHFISNSLNSINFYILDSKKEEASQYLVKFSNLLRKILHHTEHEYIRLSEEMEMIRLYLEMEKLRFKESFDWSIDKADDVSSEYKIPTMVIQPIIENAIWHGIRQAGRAGNVSLNITRRPNGIKVIVLDDGIGVTIARQTRSKVATKHKSFGTKLIRQRLTILNELYDQNYSMTIDDRSDISSGTIVILNL